MMQNWLASELITQTFLKAPTKVVTPYDELVSSIKRNGYVVELFNRIPFVFTYKGVLFEIAKDYSDQVNLQLIAVRTSERKSGKFKQGVKWFTSLCDSEKVKIRAHAALTSISDERCFTREYWDGRSSYDEHTYCWPDHSQNEERGRWCDYVCKAFGFILTNKFTYEILRKPNGH